MFLVMFAERCFSGIIHHLLESSPARGFIIFPNINVIKGAGLPSMEELLIKKNLCWTEHLLRMPTDRLPRQILYSQLPEGRRPHLRYKDTIKRHLKKRDIDTTSWKSMVLQPDVWRHREVVLEMKVFFCRM